MIGAHTSIAGGYHQAVTRGARVGCRVIQIFTGSNQQWRSRAPSEEERRLFRAAARRHAVKPVASHASYLINLAAADEALRARSEAALIEELRRSETLGLPFVVLHPGAHGGDGVERGLDRMAAAAGSALRATEGLKVRLLLETTAGQGSALGARFEELAGMLARLGNHERLGICVDTCHLFAAGYDLRTPEAYAKTMEELIAAVGLKRVRLFHLNDSKAALGSRVDRHAHIGKGALGKEPFRLLLGDPRFRRVPKVLETPKDIEEVSDRANLALLRRLARSYFPSSSQAMSM